MLFLIVSRCFKFRTLKELYGLAVHKRYEADWLDFVKDDVHWFQIWVIHAVLYAMAFYNRTRLGSTKHPIKLTAVIIGM